MTSPLVSVVIPSFNCGEFLEAAAESVLAQTMGDLEVHVVDDGSTDGTSTVLERLAARPRVYVHRQRHLGASSARNYGIRASAAPYVAWCDADDIWLPSKLELQLPPLERETTCGVVMSRHAKVLVDLTEIFDATPWPLHRGAVTRQLLAFNFVPFGTTVVRRSALVSVGNFDETLRIGHDWDLLLRLSLKWEFAFVETVTYLYRSRSGQLSSDWRGTIEFDRRILDKFDSEAGAIVPRPWRDRARAAMHVRHGRWFANYGDDYLAALAEFGKALARDPLYTPGWKSPLRTAYWFLGGKKER